MSIRWLGFLMILLAVSLPVTAQDEASPWSLEIQDVYTESRLTTTLGMDRMEYTPDTGYTFLVVEVMVDYTNATDSAVNVEIASNAIAIRDTSGALHVADGSTSAIGGCVNCQSSFPVEVAAGAQESSLIAVVFVLPEARVADKYLLEFQDAAPVPFSLGGPLSAVEAEPVEAVTTMTPAGAALAVSATPAPPTAEPLSEADVEAGLQTEMARLIDEATRTQAAELTAIATRATPTPTPDLRATAAAFLTATASAWTPTALPPPLISAPFCDEALAAGEITGNTYVCIEGDPDDWVSSGQNWLLQPPEAELFVSPSDDPTTATDCVFNVGGVCVGVDRWALSFQPAFAETFGVGLYERAERIPFNTQGRPGISVTNGNGCNEIDGTFEVRELELDADGSVVRFAVNFEQRCEGHDYGLRGYLRFNANNPG